MSMDYPSETRVRSEFQSDVTKRYIEKRKVLMLKFKDKSNAVDQLKNYLSIEGSKDTFQGSYHKGEYGEESFKWDLSKTKHTLKSSVKYNLKKKRLLFPLKVFAISSEESCIRGQNTNIDENKIELDISDADFSSLKSKKKKKKSKKKNKDATEEDMLYLLYLSDIESSNQRDRKQGRKRKFSNNSSDNYLERHKINSDFNKRELDSPVANSNSLKTIKKRKQKYKKNKVIENHSSLTSSHWETPKESNNDIEESPLHEGETDVLFNYLSEKENLSESQLCEIIFNNSSDNYVKSHEINSDNGKMKLVCTVANSNSLKPIKKKKQKYKKNKVIEKQLPLTSTHFETPRQIINDIEESATDEEQTAAISNHSSETEILFESKLCQMSLSDHCQNFITKFEQLNQMLLISTGKCAFLYFQQNPEEFEDYHVGYQLLVSKWPINPVDIIIDELRQMDEQNVIADLGCGEAKIAEAFPERTVHSFDLIALKDFVTACDMANVHLPSSSVDVVVFCVSLMGMSWKDYLNEGHGILKLGAVLKVADIETTLDNLNDFITVIEAHGFSLVNKAMKHNFGFLNFKKV